MAGADRTVKWAWIPLAGVFAVAGVLKALDPQTFARQIVGYDFVPAALVTFVAATLPWVELAAAAALVRWRAAGALIALGLSVVFLAASVQALARGLDPICGCFGGASGRVGILSLLIEIALIAFAVVTVRTQVRTSGAGKAV